MIFKILFFIGILGCTICFIDVSRRMYNLFKGYPFLSFSELYERKGLVGFLVIINMCCPMHIAFIWGISAILTIIGLSGFSTILDPFGGFFYKLFHPEK